MFSSRVLQSVSECNCLAARLRARGLVGFRPKQCLFNRDCVNVLDPDHAAPGRHICGLVLKVLDWEITAEISAPCSDENDLPASEKAQQTPFVEGEENVLMRNHINQVFQPVGNTEVPHRHTENDEIGVKEVTCQSFDLLPGVLLCRSALFAFDPGVLRFEEFDGGGGRSISQTLSTSTFPTGYFAFQALMKAVATSREAERCLRGDEMT
jgi:hypothetical protein